MLKQSFIEKAICVNEFKIEELEERLELGSWLGGDGGDGGPGGNGCCNNGGCNCGDGPNTGGNGGSGGSGGSGTIGADTKPITPAPTPAN